MLPYLSCSQLLNYNQRAQTEVHKLEVKGRSQLRCRPDQSGGKDRF